jgi:hypothetical protein
MWKITEERDGMFVRRYLAILGVAISLLIAAVLGGAIYDRHQAATAIDEFKGLDTAANPTTASLSFIRRYSRRMTEKNCHSDSCQYRFDFTNRVMSAFHLAPRADIRVYVTLYQGSLSFALVEYTSAVFKANSPIVWIQEDFCANAATSPCNYFYLDPHGHNVSETWHGNVQFAQLATPEQKRAALALNLGCVIAVRGCRDISQLLPTIWKRTGPGTVSSRMRSMADSIAETSQPLAE